VYAGTQGAGAFALEMPPCSPTPQTSCQGAAAQKASVIVRKGSPKNMLGWKWTSSGTVNLNDFGSPTSTTGYALCLYDSAGLQITARARRPRTCGRRSCWKAAGGTRFKYGDKTGTPDGLTGVQIATGAAGTGDVSVIGKGANL